MSDPNVWTIPEVADYVRDVEAEIGCLRKLLEDANRGAERNARVNQLMASDLLKVTRERDELRKPTRYALDSDGLCFVEGLGWVVRCCDAASYVARMLAQVAELKREQGEG